MRVALIESLFGSLGLSTVDSDGYRMTKSHNLLLFLILCLFVSACEEVSSDSARTVVAGRGRPALHAGLGVDSDGLGWIQEDIIS